MTNALPDDNEFYDQSFCDIDCSEEAFEGKVFDGCSFESCDFHEAAFRKCEFTDCTFLSCNLNFWKVDNSKFSDVKFSDCKISGVNWTRAYWQGLSVGSPFEFESCLLNASTFFSINQTGISIKGCRAHDVDFREANLSDAKFTDSDLTNSLFHNTNLTGANFLEAKHYSIDVTTNKVKNATFCRFEAVSLLASLGINLVG